MSSSSERSMIGERLPKGTGCDINLLYVMNHIHTQYIQVHTSTSELM